MMIRLFITFLSFTFIALFAEAQNAFQLAPPQIKFNTTFFTNEATIKLIFAQIGAHIRYTTNGVEPSHIDRIYTKPIVITKNLMTIKAKSFSNDFLPSETVSATFVKDGFPFEASFPPANSQYVGEGSTTLNNNQGGIADHTLKHWLGYNSDSVTILLSLSKNQQLKSVLFNTMQNQGGWIFFPSKVDAFAFDNDQKKFIQIGNIAYSSQQNVDDLRCKPFVIELNKTTTNQLKLIFHNQKLPPWHSGKGNNSWIFIDEIKLY
jgi:hexosaminidase